MRINQEGETVMYETTFNTYRNAAQVNTAMGRVYGHMMLAVLTSMFISYAVGTNPGMMEFFFTGITKWVVIFAPLVAVFIITPILNSDPPAPVAIAALHGFAALMGLSFAMIFVVYTMGSIFTAFMGAAVLFGTMSAYGYFTKQSLDSVGKYAFVALIAIVIASIINIFIGSTVMQMVISALAIVIFLALTAYDTQTIREMVSHDDCTVGDEVSGALTLYLNFINIFINLLQLFGIMNKDD
jgi:FtsH-binding integral membrane protein